MRKIHIQANVLDKSKEKIKILVTGGTGQLGMEFKKIKSTKKYEFFFPNSSELDLTNGHSIKDHFDKNDYKLVLNFAAYTNVDKAETDREKAKLMNQVGVDILSQETSSRNIGLIHTSTDYVFGGKGIGPYYYDSEKKPLNFYGLSKSKGEDLVLKKNTNSLIIRLSSLFSEFGNNFVKSMMSLIVNKKSINVVSDQKISLSYAGDISRNIEYLIELFNKNTNIDNNRFRILHFANKNFATWFSVAQVIYDEMRINLDNKINCELLPISSSKWESKAMRPIDSRLYVDFDLLDENHIHLKTWEERVRLVVRRVLPSIQNEIGHD